MFCEKGVTFTFDSFDRNTKTWTYGGYSTDIVVDERYVLRVPNGLDPVRAAPLMCAGITTYSPLHQFGCKPGDQVAVVGLGGLGHMVVKLAASMRADVTVLSTSRDKEKDASPRGEASRRHEGAWRSRGASRQVQPHHGHGKRGARPEQTADSIAEFRHHGLGRIAPFRCPARRFYAGPWQQAYRRLQHWRDSRDA